VPPRWECVNILPGIVITNLRNLFRNILYATAMQYAKNGTVFVTLYYSNAVLQISQCSNTREMVEHTDGSRSGLDGNELAT